MKGLLLMSLFSMNVMAVDLKWGDRVNVQEVHCEATSVSGHTKFDFIENVQDARSITDSYYGYGIEDTYMRPNFNVLSKTGNPEPLEYGTSFLSFTPTNNSPSRNRFAGFHFVIEEKAVVGSNVYNVTLLGINFGGFPSPGKTFYTYIGKGSCEVKLLKK